MANLLSAKASTEESKPRPSKALTPQEKRDWNKYVDYLDSIKMKGNEQLDKEGVGFKYLDDYIKKNPSTTLTKDKVYDIQAGLVQQKQYAQDQVKKGFAAPPQGGTAEDIMPGLSKLDSYPGSLTTKYKFTGGNLTSKAGDLLEKVEFADFSKPTAMSQFGNAPVVSKVATPIKDASAYLKQGIKMKKGGLIKGPGTSTSDEIPAMLSNGEYIVNADSVKKYGVKFLNKINGKAKKYADGGLVNLLQSKSRALVNKADTTM